MSVREYIGARYVPLIIGEWSSEVTYEPLSVVTHEGNSYTSRQYVPTGIDITNDAYWALTGNYNAQFEQLRRDVEAFSDDIEAVDDKADANANTNIQQQAQINTTGNALARIYLDYADKFIDFCSNNSMNPASVLPITNISILYKRDINMLFIKGQAVYSGAVQIPANTRLFKIPLRPNDAYNMRTVALGYGAGDETYSNRSFIESMYLRPSNSNPTHANYNSGEQVGLIDINRQINPNATIVFDVCQPTTLLRGDFLNMPALWATKLLTWLVTNEGLYTYSANDPQRLDPTAYRTDCDGLCWLANRYAWNIGINNVVWNYKDDGILIEEKQIGENLDISIMQPGDVIAYHKPEGRTSQYDWVHAAIYVGNDQSWEISSGVAVNAGYYPGSLPAGADNTKGPWPMQIPASELRNDRARRVYRWV